MDLIERVGAYVAASDRATVLTGAGISTESGIPDYRGPDGLWTKDPEAMRLVTIGPYMEDPDVRRLAWKERLDHPAWTAQPGPGHFALVDLERSGKLLSLLTQNIDGLPRAAGSSPEVVVELHGTLHRAICMECGSETPMHEQLDRVRSGEEDPRCTACGGIQKSATVSFGQPLPVDAVLRAAAASSGCDLFMAIGTSLQVHPAALFCAEAIRRGARCVIVNGEPTPLDERADAVVRGSIGEVLPAIMRAAGVAA